MRNDDWDSGTDTTQYLVRFYEGANQYIELLLDTTANELAARGRDGVAVAWEITADTSGYADADWYDVLLTYDSSSAELFVNGASQGTKSNPKLPDGVTAIHVGTDESGANPWKGLIDELVLFNDALTSSQAQSIQDRAGGAANTT